MMNNTSSRKLYLHIPQLSARILVTLILSAVLLLGCGKNQTELSELNAVDKPKDLEQLDKGVRIQFEEYWTALQQNRDNRKSAEQLANAWGMTGQWFHAYQYDTSARLCYLNAAHIDPTDPRWPYYLGLITEKSSEIEKAMAFYERSAELAPEATEPHLKLANLKLQQQEFEEARTLYEKILGLRPESPGALFGLGKIELAQGNADSAIVLFEKILQTQPQASQVQYAMATAWRRVGELKRANEHLRKVPEDNMSQVLLASHTPWEQALHMIDQGSQTLNRRGVQASRQGQHVKAAIFFGRAVQANPNSPETRINYALALRRTGHVPAAEKQLRQALELAGQDRGMTAKANMELGRLYHSLQKAKDAVRYLKIATEQDPFLVPAKIELARLYHSDLKLEAALPLYRESLALDPSLVETRFWVAAILTQLDRNQEALQELREQAQAFPDYRPSQLLLVRILSTLPESRQSHLLEAEEILNNETKRDDVLFAETAAMLAAAESEFSSAQDWQTKALTALRETNQKNSIKVSLRRLELYRQGLASKSPWDSTETISTTPLPTP